MPVGTTFAVPATRAEKVDSGAVVSIRESMRSSYAPQRFMFSKRAANRASLPAPTSCS